MSETPTTPSPEADAPQTRVFKYDGRDFPDPGAQYTNEQVRDMLREAFPELANCQIKTSTSPDSKTEVTFTKVAGTKGAS